MDVELMLLGCAYFVELLDEYSELMQNYEEMNRK